MRLTLSLMIGAVLVGGIAVAQNRPSAPDRPAPAATQAGDGATDDAAAAMGAKPGAAKRRGGAEALRAFLGLGVAPDAIAAGRGQPIFAQNCAACHGPDARGGMGPNLLYSGQVLDDDHGEKLSAFLKVGRPEKGMPPFASLGDRDLIDIAEFLHLQVENYANRGTYQNNNNILAGDAAKGAAYFRKNCVACHAATGDLKGIAARYRPLDLQRAMIFPPREDHPARAIRATVTTSAGAVEGRVTKVDDFTIVLVDAQGTVHAFRRDDGVRVALHDPLEWHQRFSYRLKDKDMTDLVTYLGSLK